VLRNEIKLYKSDEDYDIFSNVTDIGFTINFVMASLPQTVDILKKAFLNSRISG